MAKLKFEREDPISRAEAVKRLRAVADALAGSGSTAELEVGAQTLTFPVGPEMRCELELELDGDEIELELELKWSTAKPAAKPRPGPKARKSRARSRKR
jgi:amphi-Trp domain-containing protein